MNYRTAERELAKVSYKNWDVWANQPYSGYPGKWENLIEVEFSFLAPDSRDYPNYARQSIAGSRFTIDLDKIGEDEIAKFHRIVFDQFYAWERHESQEFYKVGGRSPFHPHRPDGRDLFERTAGPHPALKYAVAA